MTRVEAGVVGDLGGEADLTADVHGDDERREVLAGGVHRGGEPGGTGADDRDVVDVAQRRPLAAPEPPVELAGGVQVGEVVVAADLLAVEEDLGHAAHARAFDHLGLARLVGGHVDLVVGDRLGVQQRLGLEAVRAPLLGVDLDLCHARFPSRRRRRRPDRPSRTSHCRSWSGRNGAGGPACDTDTSRGRSSTVASADGPAAGAISRPMTFCSNRSARHETCRRRPPTRRGAFRPNAARELEEKRRTFDASRLFAEKERIAARGRIRQFMFGSLDGLLVPLGVVSGVAGGTSNSKIVVVAGVAEAFAGALSMGAGEYLSGKSEAQVQQAAIRDEEEEIAAIPDIEQLEIELLFEHEGLSRDDAVVVADKVTSSHRSWVNTMVEKELGLSAEPEGSALKDSLAMGASYLARVARAARALPLPCRCARRFVAVGRPHDRRAVADRPGQGAAGAT